MPTFETAIQRGARRGRYLRARTGDELRIARTSAGLSLRRLCAMVGISRTQVMRIERAESPNVGVEVLARIAAVLGLELAVNLFPNGSPVRDAGHLALLGRLRARIGPGLTWRSEVSMPFPGDLRSADGLIDGPGGRVIVEAETRLGDVQALERRIGAKQRDLGATRCLLLVTDSRHNRDVVRDTPWLVTRFPVQARRCLASLARGQIPDGDALVFL